MSKIYLLIVATLFSFNSFGQVNFCTKELESFPTRNAGRIKPLYVLANDTLKFISGNTKFAEMSATEAFCKLSLQAFGMPEMVPLTIKVEHVKAKELLGLKDSDTGFVAKDADLHIGTVETEIAQLQENDGYKKELTKVSQRIKAYQGIIEARIWTVPEPKGESFEFVTLGQFLTEERVEAARTKAPLPVNYLFSEAKDHFVKVEGDGYLLELTYFKMNPFLWAMLISILAIVFLVSIKNKIPALVLIGLSIAIQIAAMTMRVLISGRAPVTNMYETVMFSGFGALIIGCIIYSYRRKETMFLLAGLGCNILSLMMMKLAHGMLEPGISPLVPVLRDNFWLSTHVTTIILSYAALALSWLIANGLLIRSRFFTVSRQEYRYAMDLAYTCIKWGVVLLAAGIILGGIWADYSWGRFWGWDPKETWSLIVLLIYMAILHGKSTTWIPPQRFIPLVAAAFMSVMMAWFGVNYILASGLHSYGFSEGGAIFLGSFFAVQTFIILVAIIKPKEAKDS